ncbi:MAG TPA: hypothetical protein VG324_29555, partial [Blastocatellia bacterium]|nr:hypothetical protein [Blastocatellia bacterium]
NEDIPGHVLIFLSYIFLSGLFPLIPGFRSHYLPFAIVCDKIASLNRAPTIEHQFTSTKQ